MYAPPDGGLDSLCYTWINTIDITIIITINNHITILQYITIITIDSTIVIVITRCYDY